MPRHGVAGPLEHAGEPRRWKAALWLMAVAAAAVMLVAWMAMLPMQLLSAMLTAQMAMLPLSAMLMAWIAMLSMLLVRGSIVFAT